MRTNTILACIVVLLLSGCSALRGVTGYKDPSVRAKNIRFLDADFEKVDLAVDLVVNNPNKAAASLSGYDYAVMVGGAQLIKGVQESSVAIPAQGNATVSIPVSFRYADIYRLYGTLANSDSFTYAVASTLRFDVPVLGTVSLPVSHEGELPVVRMPTVAIDSAKMKNLSLSGASMNLSLRVTNPNPFSLNVNRMVYTVDVNGDTWVSGTTPKPIAVKERSDTVVDIPVLLNLGAMKNAAYSTLVSDKPLRYKLESTLDLGTSNPLLKQITLPLARTGEFKIPR